MALPALDPHELHVLVFGPGTGELVAVRAPPDAWMIVDGCGVGRTKYATALLEHYRASPQLIALTHPHRDHAVGVADAVDAYTQGPPSTWPKLGLLWPSPRDRVSMRNIQAYFAGGLVEDALSAIRDRWRRGTGSKWSLDVGSRTRLGAATITVISPERGPRREALRAWSRRQPHDPNRIASAFDVSWNGHHVILGSDLVERPGNGWTSAQARCASILVSTKVPHHGSVNAIHGAWGRGTPHLVVTPFASSNLPRFEPSGGVARMLQAASTVHLTGLPRAHGAQAGSVQRVTRRQLERLGDEELDPKTPGWPDCYVIVSIAANGTSRMTHGPGSLRVTEPPRRRSAPRRR